MGLSTSIVSLIASFIMKIVNKIFPIIVNFFKHGIKIDSSPTPISTSNAEDAEERGIEKKSLLSESASLVNNRV